MHGFPEFWYAWKHQLPALEDAGTEQMDPTSVADPLRQARLPLRLNHSSPVCRCRGLGRPFEEQLTSLATIAAVSRLLTGSTVQSCRPACAGISTSPTSNRSESVDQLLRSWYVLFFQLPALPEASLGWNDFTMLERIRLTDRPALTPSPRPTCGGTSGRSGSRARARPRSTTTGRLAGGTQS